MSEKVKPMDQMDSYAAPDAPLHSVEHLWLHRMSDIIGALVRAGLRINSFEEYPYVAWPMFPWMEQRPDGAWQFPEGVDTSRRCFRSPPRMRDRRSEAFGEIRRLE
ncbi:MAG: hypothetical protein HYR72_23505 [Deltaproteobacteria bacterium]|nr:hypothetical protein [Deltaproteobacteria bacterium]MBI3389067.1 hypothetical protein [Deltaproteobacteria bacterium]